MITIFSIPRAFEGHIDLVQRNALTSWSILKNSPQIILLGNEIGTSEICKEYGIDFIPDVKLSSYGTPFVKDVFDKARVAARYDTIAFINADIILTNTFINAIVQAKKEFTNFLLIGQRYDIDIKERMDFESSSWEQDFINKIKLEGKLHAPCGLDYHVFKKDYCFDILPFVIGRSAYDCWITAQFIKKGNIVIDCTKFIYAIHQKHEPNCLENGSLVLEGYEADNNKKLAGQDVHKGYTLHATWIMTGKGEIEKRIFEERCKSES